MRRRQMRIRGFDYRSPGLYFVTSCVYARHCIFGDVVDEDVLLTSIGEAAQRCLIAIPEHHPGVSVDAYVVMPNHVHAILELLDWRAPLGTVVGTFKAAVTRSTGRTSLWQRGFYEHVVRDEPDLARIREYIETNPIRWALDPENPARCGL